MTTSDARHSRLGATNGGIHTIVAFEYANAAARIAALTSLTNLLPPLGDIGKVALQIDNGTFWIFVGGSWTALTGGGGGGEANTGSNVGAGAGVFRDKTGVTLNFRSLTAQSSKIAITQNADTVSINANASAIEADVASSPRPPSTHANSHLTGGSDPIPVATTVADGLFSAADKALLQSLSTGNDSRDLVIDDHFFGGNHDLDEFGKMGWRTFINGAGATLDMTGEVGHPGIARLTGGTAGNARTAICLGDAAGVGGRFFFGPTQNVITAETLLKFSGLNSVLGTSLEEMVWGFGLNWDSDVALADGIFLRFAPAAPISDLTYKLVCVNAGTSTVVDSGVTPTANRWDRWEIVITNNPSTSVQLRRNGANVGSAITTNIPTSGMGYGYRVRSVGGTSPVLLADYTRVYQQTAKEDP